MTTPVDRRRVRSAGAVDASSGSYGGAIGDTVIVLDGERVARALAALATGTATTDPA